MTHLRIHFSRHRQTFVQFWDRHLGKFLPQLPQRDSEDVAANTNRIVGQKLRAKQEHRMAKMFIRSSNFEHPTKSLRQPLKYSITARHWAL